MVARNILQLIGKVLVYLLAYVFVANQLSLFGVALCFSYTGAILLLPISTNPVRILLFSFIAGFAMDIFHSSPGIHTSSCLLMAFFRASFLNWMVPAGGYEENMNISIPSMGFRWYLPFSLGLLFMHSFLYFLLDYASFGQFGMVLLRSVLSAILTCASIVLLQFAIEPPKRADY
jgi:hypothetical protein